MKNMLRETQCPECGASWDGGSIIETYIKQRDEGYEVWQGKTDEEIEQHVKNSYSEPYRWGRQIGITDWGADMTRWVACPDCKTIFERFGGKNTGRKFDAPQQPDSQNDKENQAPD
jgi:hypothetical protein